MNENKKSVKRVLVLDHKAIDFLSNIVLHRTTINPEIFFEMLSYVVRVGDTPDSYSIDCDEFINVDFAELFYTAYGKEVSE